MVQDFIDNSEWVPVHTLPGYECCIEYYVNKKGQVKSTKRNKDHLLKPKVTNRKYLRVNLTQRIGRGRVLSVDVHILVALAFLPPPPTPPGRGKNNSMVYFKDGDTTNVCAENLFWIKASDPRKSFRRESAFSAPQSFDHKLKVTHQS